jgi:hypothetical protein
MWKSHPETIDSETIRSSLTHDGKFISFREFVDLLQTSQEFRSFFAATIAESPFQAFFWETPPVSNQTLDQQFEFVVLKGHSLFQLRPDPSPFESQFLKQPTEPVLTFANLGGDALLIVPRPIDNHASYTHLANFLRNAPKFQVSALWKCAGAAVQKRISDLPMWISTAGLGVSWLHLRLDSRPKYLRFEPYKNGG